MKIDQSTPPSPASQIGELSPRPNVTPPSGGSQASVESTSVNLGTTANHIRTLEKSIAGSPAVNTAKVDEIKQAITEGRFQVNSGAVADSLISTVKDLISASQR